MKTFLLLILTVTGLQAGTFAFNAQMITPILYYWPLDEASGSRSDLVNGKTLTDNNTVGTNTGPTGNSATITSAEFITANSEYLSISASSVYFTNLLSISFWVYFNNTNTTCQLISKDASASREFTIQRDANSFFYFYSPATGVLTSTCYPTDSVWHNVIITHDNVTCRLYVDNVSCGSVNGKWPTKSTTEFRMGARVYVGNQNYLGGRMSSVKWFNGILTESERKQLQTP